jgi:hypothetical protein
MGRGKCSLCHEVVPLRYRFTRRFAGRALFGLLCRPCLDFVIERLTTQIDDPLVTDLIWRLQGGKAGQTQGQNR